MISNITRNTLIASRIEIAQNPWQRMKGLLGAKDFAPGRALIITPCQSIHMFFMKFPIDAIFCNGQNKVVGLCLGIKPFCLSPIFLNSSYVIELPAGSIATSKTQVGDELRVITLNSLVNKNW